MLFCPNWHQCSDSKLHSDFNHYTLAQEPFSASCSVLKKAAYEFEFGLFKRQISGTPLNLPVMFLQIWSGSRFSLLYPWNRVLQLQSEQKSSAHSFMCPLVFRLSLHSLPLKVTSCSVWTVTAIFHLLCFCQSLVDLTGLKSLSWKHFFDGNMQLLVFSCKKTSCFQLGVLHFFISNIFGLNGGKVCEVEGRRNMSVWCWRPAAAAHWAAVGVLRLICLPRVPCFLWCLG